MVTLALVKVLVESSHTTLIGLHCVNVQHYIPYAHTIKLIKHDALLPLPLGDMEKELGRTPLQQNDRKKACIPSLQIKFTDFIAAPLYNLLAELLPAVQTVVDQLEVNRIVWESISIKHNLEANHNCVK